MKTDRLLKSVAAAAVLALALFSAAPPARANVQVMCSPDVAGGVQGPRTIGGANVTPSGTLYSLNGQGCTQVQLLDIGWFQSQGFTQGPLSGSFIYRTGTLSCQANVAANLLPGGVACTAAQGSPQIGAVPPSAAIRDIILQNNSTTFGLKGGLDFGTSVAGTNITSGYNCPASCLESTRSNNGQVLVNILSTVVFPQVSSQFVATPIFVSAVTDWNSTDITITVIYDYF